MGLLDDEKRGENTVSVKTGRKVTNSVEVNCLFDPFKFRREHESLLLPIKQHHEASDRNFRVLNR